MPLVSLGSTTPTISNKENMGSEPVSATIRTRVAKNKIKYYLKIAADVIDFNYCPEASIQICIKIYQTMQK